MSTSDEGGLGAVNELRATYPGVEARGHPELSADRRFCQWRLPSVGSAIPQIRREVRAFLLPAELAEDQLQDLVLAVCEAATNALEHAQNPAVPFFDVSADIGRGVVTVEVRDHGQWREPASSPYRGHGLAMMRALTDTTISTSARGTTVTIRMSRSGDQAPAVDGWAS